MGALELRNTEIRIQRTGGSSVYKYRANEVKVARVVVNSLAPKDPYGGVVTHRQTAWAWQISTLKEMTLSEAKLLGLTGLGSILNPDTDPPSFTIEMTTPDGINRRFIDCAMTSITIPTEKRGLVALETNYNCRIARETFDPLVVTVEEPAHRPISGLDCSVYIDDVQVDTYAAQVEISRPEYIPTNFDTHGEARSFKNAGRWNATIVLSLAGDNFPVNNPIERHKVKIVYGNIGSITAPTLFQMKANQTMVADDFDDRIIMGRAEVAPQSNFLELDF
jgi:hypothetical protein